MREKRWLQNKKLREAAMAEGLAEGREIVIRERSILKDGGYITRQIRKGRVLILYPYHFYCALGFLNVMPFGMSGHKNLPFYITAVSLKISHIF